MLSNPDWVEACAAIASEAANARFFAMRRIAETVCRRRGLTLRVVMGNAKRREILEARQEIFWRCARDLGKTYAEIGRAFNRDHSTIRHGVMKYEGREPVKAKRLVAA